MSVQKSALASLTATYTDSEGEDGVDDNLQHYLNIPEGIALQIGQIGQPPSNNDGTAILVSEALSKLNGKPGLEISEQQSSNCQEDFISDNEADAYGVVIPSAAPGLCPAEVQQKITNLFQKVESGLDMSQLIQQRKEFRNPSIYEKLIQFCGINELGTNYPTDRFDPFKWGKASYYEALAEAQIEEMKKLEKAKKDKTKIEIVSGTVKRPSSTTATVEEDTKKRKKSKWDQLTTNSSIAAPAKLGVATQPALTSSTTGTKATVISTFGSLPKKRL